MWCDEFDTHDVSVLDKLEEVMQDQVKLEKKKKKKNQFWKEQTQERNSK